MVGLCYINSQKFWFVLHLLATAQVYYKTDSPQPGYSEVFHAPFIQINPGFKFYAVWERTKNLAEQKYPGVKTFRSSEEMHAGGCVELVVVNSPNYTHYNYAKMALEAGKHVIVEKPFTITSMKATN